MQLSNVQTNNISFDILFKTTKFPVIPTHQQWCTDMLYLSISKDPLLENGSGKNYSS